MLSLTLHSSRLLAAPGDQYWDDRFGATGLGNVIAITNIGSNLYAGGGFTTVSPVSATNIAMWDGTNWSALGSGAAGVDALAVIRDTVYVGGQFVTAGGIPSPNFAIWSPPFPSAGIVFLPNGYPVLTWTSQSNETYQVLSTTNLAFPFTPLGSPGPSGGSTTSYTNTSRPGPGQFYKVQQL